MGLFDKLFGKKETSPSGARVLRHEGPGERPAGFANVPEEWSKTREQFYKTYFGNFKHVYHEVAPSVPHIDVYPCEPDPIKGRDYYTFVTGGMSDLPMNTPPNAPPEARRVELIMYVSSADVQKWEMEGIPFPQEFLRMVAAIPHAHNTWFGTIHHVATNKPREPIIPGSQLTSLMFLNAAHEPPYVQNGLKLGPHPVSFLWVVPLTDAEIDFKLQHGGDELVRVMWEHNHPQVLDVMRKSYV